jgi:malto-oligosyltrehalose trehalohydrolase
MKSAHDMPFGAALTRDGVRFAIWAPSAEAAQLEVDGRCVSMQRDAQGFFRCFDARATAGSRYAFRFDGAERAVPDPASRFNPDGVHAPAEVVDANAYEWRDEDWRGRPFRDAVIYELHVGTFTPQGTYAAAAERLDYLAALGVTAIELMPLAATPGRWNWGYDGVLPFAPHEPYGRPDDLKRFVDAAHARGLMVLLDVVYNHFGPEGNYLGCYARQFFTARHQTPWGDGINFDDRSSGIVRQFFIHNALYWVEEYHFDGLRLDAVHAIMDDSEPNFLHGLAAAVRAMPSRRELHLVLENDRNDAELLARDATRRPVAFTGQWNDDFHHALFVLLTGETRGHYADYAEPAKMLLRALQEGFAYQGEYSAYRSAARGSASAALPPEAFVNFLQNHDQIGNRPDAARLWMLLEPSRMLAAETLLALLPTPILVFMGDEFHAPSGFPFFCDFGEELARAVTAGRRSELGTLWQDAAAAAVPGPATEAARDAARLDWGALTREPHERALARARERFTLRRRELAPRLPARPAGGTLLGLATLTARWSLADETTLTVAANLADVPFPAPAAPRGRTLLSSTEAVGGPWPPWHVEWAIER